MADGGERLSDRGVLLRRNSQNLRLIVAMLGHDHESGGTLALDVELDSAQPIEGNIEVRPIWAADYCQAPIGHDKPCAITMRFNLNFLIALEQLSKWIV